MIGVEGNLFVEVGLVIIFAALAAYTMRLFKQPQILAYVLVGILITPIFHVVTKTSIIESMSVVGIAFLLFIVGLEMDLNALKNVALVSSLGGMIQIIIVFVFGYLLSLLLGYLSLEAAYIGLLLAFSSTMVVMKILSDRRELNTLHGQLAVGILLMQDIVAILALSVLTSINGFSIALFGIAVGKFLIMFGVVCLLSKYVFPSIFEFAAKNQELLLISSLAVCFILSLAFYYLGFSIAVGAFIAGIALGNLHYSLDIISKVKSLKDFFSLLFFVSLGMTIDISVFKDNWVTILVLLAFVMTLKPFIIMVVCSLFKYTKKPSFLTANSLAQIGEFSLILVAQGLSLNHISQDLFSVTVIVTIISITLTSYYIEYSSFFYRLLERPLRFFDKFTTEGLEYLSSETKPKIVLCGHNRIGYSILKKLHRKRKQVLVVDYNPEVITRIIKEGFHCIYGDVTDEEIIEKMNPQGLSILISTVPELHDNILLIKRIRNVNKKAKIFVTALSTQDALRLYKEGADYVVLPHFIGGEHVSNMIEELESKKIDLRTHREEHIAYIKERIDLGQEHPNPV